MMTSHMMPRVEGQEFGDSAGTGYLLHWTREKGFEKVPGTEVRLANGFELSPDEKTIYLNSSMGDGLRRIDRATGEVTGHAEVSGALDNTTWSPDGMLLVAHLLADDNAEFEACSELDGGYCPIPFQILAVDPATMEVAVRFDGAGSPMGAGTVGLQVDDELFIGSFAGDRILRVDLSSDDASPRP